MSQQHIPWTSKPCKALTPECGYYGPTTTNINKVPYGDNRIKKPSRVLPEELQRKYDCAAETGYPGCLIAASPGAPTCKLAVNKEMSDKFQACLNSDWTKPIIDVFPIAGGDTTTTTQTKTAGLGGSNLVMIAIIGGFLYYAYSKGLLRK